MGPQFHSWHRLRRAHLSILASLLLLLTTSSGVFVASLNASVGGNTTTIFTASPGTAPSTSAPSASAVADRFVVLGVSDTSGTTLSVQERVAAALQPPVQVSNVSLSVGDGTARLGVITAIIQVEGTEQERSSFDVEMRSWLHSGDDVVPGVWIAGFAPATPQEYTFPPSDLPTGASAPTQVCAPATFADVVPQFQQDFTVKANFVHVHAWEYVLDNSTVHSSLVTSNTSTRFDALPVGSSTLRLTSTLGNTTMSHNQPVTVVPELSTVSETLLSATIIDAGSEDQVVVGVNEPQGSQLSVVWRVLSGSAVLTAINGSLDVHVRGIGPCVIEGTFTDLCLDTFVSLVAIRFNSRSSCLASTTCSGHGVCTANAGCSCFGSTFDGYWAGLECNECQQGYSGANCSTRDACVPGVSCLNGECRGSPPTCVCHRNVRQGFWDGPTCSRCVRSAGEGFFGGDNCTACLEGYHPLGACTVFCADDACGGHGACGAAGSCVCHSSPSQGFWLGEFCSACQSQYTGASCNVSCNAGFHCSGHGTCTDGPSTPEAAACACHATLGTGFWTSTGSEGPRCTACSSDWSGAQCSQFSGTNLEQRQADCAKLCRNGACDARSGTCVCARSWGGEWCDRCANSTTDGYWSGTNCTVCARGFFAPSTGCTSRCPELCNGHGTCSGTATCMCDASAATGYWRGATCGQCQADWYGSQCNILCTNASCVNGRCNTHTGDCDCNFSAADGFYAGASCSVCHLGFSESSGCRGCARHHYGARCVRCIASDTCSGHGSCSTEDGSCTCYNSSSDGYWGGSNCATCAGEYLPPSCLETQVLTSSNCSGAVPPRVLSATWRQGFVGFVLTTSAAVVGHLPTCEQLFLPQTYALLGTDPACNWANATTVIVTLGHGFTFSGDHALRTQRGSFRAETDVPGCPRAADESFLVPSAPAASLLKAPVVSIKTKQTVGLCEDIVIDASASVSPSPRMTHQLLAVDVNASQTLRKAAASAAFNDRRFATLASWAMPVDTPRRFLVAGTDLVLGTTAVSAELTITRRAAAVPQLVIAGPSPRDHVASDTLTLVAEANYSPCYTSVTSTALQFEWKVNGTSADAFNGTANAAFVSFKPFALPVRAVPYDIEVSVHDPTHAVTAFASTLVHVRSSVVVATLDAPTGPVWTSQNVTLEWTCSGVATYQRSAFSCAGTCEPLVLAQAVASSTSARDVYADTVRGTIVLPDGWATSNGTAQWQVTCHSVDGGVELAAAETAASDAPVSMQPLLVRQLSKRRVVPANTKWSAFVTDDRGSSTLTGLEYRWSCAPPCTLDLTSPLVAPMGAETSTLVIAAGNLQVGDYQFLVAVVNTSSGAQQQLSVSMRVVPPPALGRVELPARTYTAMQTTAGYVSGWVSGSPELGPLVYSAVVFDELGQETMVLSQTASPEFEFRVPRRHHPHATAQLVVSITDAGGGRTDVVVPLLQDSATVAGDTLLQHVNNSARRGSSRDLLGAVVAAANAGVGADLLINLTQTVPLETGQGDRAADTYTALARSTEVPSLSSPSGALDASLAAVQFSLSDALAHSSTPEATAQNSLELLSLIPTEDASNGTTDDGVALAYTRLDILSGIVTTMSQLQQKRSALGELTEIATTGLSMQCRRTASGVAPGSLPSRSAGSEVEVVDRSIPSVDDGSAVSDLCNLVLDANPFASVDPNTTLVSSVQTIDLRSGSGRLISVTDTVLRITIPLTPGSSTNSSFESVCSFFNITLGRFDTSGCRTVNRTASRVHCECTHLTDFGLKLNPVDVGNFEDAKVAAIVYVCCLVALLLLLMPAAFVWDQKRQRDFIDFVWDEDVRITALIGAIRSDLSQEPLKRLMRIRETPEVFDARKSKAFVTWLSIFKETLSEGHPWLAPLSGHPSSNFTIPQRVVCLFVLLASQLFTNGWFFEADGDDGFTSAMAQTLIATAVSVPISIVAVQICAFFFVNSQRSSRDARYQYQSQHVTGAIASAEKKERRAAKLAEPVQDHDNAGELSSDSDSDGVDIKQSVGIFQKPRQSSSKVIGALGVAPSGAFDVLAPSSEEGHPFPRFDHTACEITAPIVGLNVTSEEIGQIAASFTSSRRHLIAITLHATCAGYTVSRLAHLNTSKVGATPLQVCEVLRTALGFTRNVSADTKNPVIQSLPASTNPSAYVLSVVLQAYVNSTSNPVCSAEMPAPTGERQLLRELYADEMNGVVWRLAIECVKEREFAMAEALFIMHLILEHPDLYLVLFDVAVPSDTLEVLRYVCSVSRPGAAGTFRDNLHPGRLWASYYALRLLGFQPSKYAQVHASSAIVSPAVIAVLLGLHEVRAPILAGGCTPHVLDIETNRRRPQLASIPGLLSREFVAKAREKNLTIRVAEAQFHSKVLQAHALRLAPKPLVDQRPDADADDRIAAVVAAQVGVSAPTRAAQAAVDATEVLNKAAIGDDINGSPQVRKRELLDYEREATKTDAAALKRFNARLPPLTPIRVDGERCLLQPLSRVVREMTRPGSPFYSMLTDATLPQERPEHTFAPYSPLDLRTSETADAPSNRTEEPVGKRETHNDAEAAPEEEGEAQEEDDDVVVDEARDVSIPAPSASALQRQEEALQRAVENLLQAKIASRHTNFYSTIECGRMMAMLHHAAQQSDGAESTGRTTAFHQFAMEYIAECDDLGGSGTRSFGIAFDPTMESWKDARGGRPLRPSDLPQANNLFSPRTRLYDGDVPSEAALIKKVRSDERAAQMRLLEEVGMADPSAADDEKGEEGPENLEEDTIERIADDPNSVLRMANFSDPVLHLIISRAVRTGGIEIPVDPDILYTGAERATLRFAMPYDDIDHTRSLATSSRYSPPSNQPDVVSGDGELATAPSDFNSEAEDMRCVAESGRRLGALAGLCRLHPPTGAGLGTPTCPHVGIASACNSARVGSRVVLLPGAYRPTTLRHLHGTIRHPLVVCPIGYHAMIREKARAMASENGDAGYLSHVNLDGASAPDSAVDVIEASSVIAPFVGAGATVMDPLHSPLTAEEKALLPHVEITPAENRESATAEDAEGSRGSLLSFVSCDFVTFVGVELHGAKAAVETMNCISTTLEHCHVYDCDLAVSSTDGIDAVPIGSNDVQVRASEARQALAASRLHPGLNLVGYFFAVGLFVFFCVFSLFLTADFSDAKANEWIVRFAVTSALVGLVVTPAQMVPVSLLKYGLAKATLITQQVADLLLFS